jgi:hypothetical protein
MATQVNPDKKFLVTSGLKTSQNHRFKTSHA